MQSHCELARFTRTYHRPSHYALALCAHTMFCDWPYCSPAAALRGQSPCPRPPSPPGVSSATAPPPGEAHSAHRPRPSRPPWRCPRPAGW
eukprot:1184748-Prorocentrum_minimum.AAC.3